MRGTNSRSSSQHIISQSPHNLRSTPGQEPILPAQRSNVIPLRDTQAYAKMARSFKPTWDGKPLTWKKFWIDFQFYWNLQAESYAHDERMQRLLFMECLPTADADRVKYWIQQDDITFDALVQKFADKADTIIPRYSWEAQ